jgi:anti-anti-sigma factor
MTEPFEAIVRHQPNLVIIDLYGEINAFADLQLSEAYTQAEEYGTSTVVLNFGQVSYINSTGIALIVGLLGRARKTGQRLVVYGLSDHYKQIFRITRLSEYMSIYPDEASALAGVK